MEKKPNLYWGNVGGGNGVLPISFSRSESFQFQLDFGHCWSVSLLLGSAHLGNVIQQLGLCEGPFGLLVEDVLEGEVSLLGQGLEVGHLKKNQKTSVQGLFSRTRIFTI